MTMASSKPKIVPPDEGVEIVPDLTCFSFLNEGPPSLMTCFGLGAESENKSKRKEARADTWESARTTTAVTRASQRGPSRTDSMNEKKVSVPGDVRMGSDETMSRDKNRRYCNCQRR
jgi:hypothetical protein